VQLAVCGATDTAIAKLGTPVVRVNELDERCAACLERTGTPVASTTAENGRASTPSFAGFGEALFSAPEIANPPPVSTPKPEPVKNKGR
jgi:hypothetical protein